MTELNTAVIVDAVRTPSGKGKPGGALSGVHPVDLLATAIEALITRTGLDPALVEDVIAGCAQQVGDQSGNIARNASLAAGLPEAVPATTINRQCGSSQQAATFAAQGVMAGGYDVVIAAGVESMSAVPLGSSRPASLGQRNAARYPEGLVHPTAGHAAQSAGADRRPVRAAGHVRGRRDGQRDHHRAPLSQALPVKSNQD